MMDAKVLYQAAITPRPRKCVEDDLCSLFGVDATVAGILYTLYRVDSKPLTERVAGIGIDWDRFATELPDILMADRQDDGTWKTRIPETIGWYDGACMRQFHVDTDNETVTPID